MDVGRGEERVICVERVTWKLTLTYVKYIAKGNFLCLRKLKQELCINLERWDGERDWEGGSKGSGYLYTYG